MSTIKPRISFRKMPEYLSMKFGGKDGMGLHTFAAEERVGGGFAFPWPPPVRLVLLSQRFPSSPHSASVPVFLRMNCDEACGKQAVRRYRLPCDHSA